MLCGHVETLVYIQERESRCTGELGLVLRCSTLVRLYNTPVNHIYSTPALLDCQKIVQGNYICLLHNIERYFSFNISFTKIWFITELLY